MTAADWRNLLSQPEGFKISISPGTPAVPPRRKHDGPAPYGSIRKLAADFLDHPERFDCSLTECASRNRVSLASLSAALSVVRASRQQKRR